jgi:nucleotide-binding universal stress UspA family protein
MKKILVPIDFSETSENAFVYALEMAKLYKAELVLLHSFELPVLDSQTIPLNYVEIYDTLELANSDHFSDEMSKLEAIAKEQDASHIRMNHILMDGELTYCIKEVIRQENIDFVVMGTHGASGWFDTFLGTNTSSLISDIEIPVLSVSHDTKFHKMETIGFTTRYKEEDMHALKEVLVLAKKMNAKVKCLYVKTMDSEFRGEAINFWETYYENEDDLEFFIIPSEDIEGTIEDFLTNQSIDMLAMVAHKKSFFTQLFTTSTTQKMSLHSKTPILAIYE